MDRSATFLKKALKANAIFSLLSGIFFTLFYRWVASLTGITPEISVLITGLILVAFALFVWFVSNQQPISKLLVWLIIDLDLLWIAGTVISILYGMYSVTGNWVMGILSLLVLDFAIAQFIGLRKQTAQTQTAGS